METQSGHPVDTEVGAEASELLRRWREAGSPPEAACEGLSGRVLSPIRAEQGPCPLRVCGGDQVFSPVRGTERLPQCPAFHTDDV